MKIFRVLSFYSVRMGKKRRKRFQRGGEKRWKRAVERGREALPRPGGSMAEVPLNRPIFIRVWVEGKKKKKKLLVIRAKTRNFGTTTMNRGTHLDGIFFLLPLPPFLGGKRARRGERFSWEREGGARSYLLFPSWKKRKVTDRFEAKSCPNVGYNSWLLHFHWTF